MMSISTGSAVEFALSETYPRLGFTYRTQGDIVLEGFRITYAITSNGTIYVTVHAIFETRGMRPFMQMSFEGVPESKISVYDPCLVSITTFYIQRGHNRDWYVGAFWSQAYYKAEQNTYSINLTDQVAESQKGLLRAVNKDPSLLNKVVVRGGIDVFLFFKELAGQTAEKHFYIKFDVSGLANTTSLTMEILLPEEASVEQAKIDDKEIARYPPYLLQCELQVKPNEESPVYQAVVFWSLPLPPKVVQWYEHPIVQTFMVVTSILGVLGILESIARFVRSIRRRRRSS